MMKYIVCIGLFLVMLGVAFGQYEIFSNTGEKIETLEALVDRLSKNDVVFFGEIHDDIIAHGLEFEILSRLSGRWEKTALSLEMLEADGQRSLNSFLDGKISEDEFKQSVSLWGNYDTDYRVMVEFAKLKKIPVIAGNIPRRLAKLVSSNGISAWDKLSKTEKQYLPRETFFKNDRYRELFEMTMKDNPMMKRMPDVSMDNLYHAQCVKDEKMAESIVDFLKKNPDFKVFVINGSFHSDYHLGTVQKLKLRMPELKIVTISAIPVDDISGINPNEYSEKADFIIFTQKNSSESY